MKCAWQDAGLDLPAAPNGFTTPDHARLSEAHHRIANNLALIAGFVRLEASSVGRAGRPVSAAEARRTLEEIGVRIETVGRLHRLLSQEPGKARVDVGDYLSETCRVLEQSISYEGPVELLCDAHACEVAPEQAGLLGLIVTELVTNAVKYAHPAGAPGRIEVRCHGDQDGRLRLSVTDDGVGLPDGFDPMTDGGLGLRVVRSLSRQLSADLSFENEGLGLSVWVTLPAQPNADVTPLRAVS